MHVAAEDFADVLKTPAQISPLAARSLLQSVARAGGRLVAVGQRGHILVSSDGGRTWKQSDVPVSSDLTSVFFADESEGWAAGHDGVILHTSDGGSTWALQLSGVDGGDKPFLDLWFSDSRNGYAVGAYNLVYRTSDGGKTWESVSDRTDNP